MITNKTFDEIHIGDNARKERMLTKQDINNAISKEAALIKGIVSPVAGEADILLVPDLEAGNMLAKQLAYLGRADSAGIVLGARVPIILTSRADSAEARLASCAVAAAFAHWLRENQKIKKTVQA